MADSLLLESKSTLVDEQSYLVQLQPNVVLISSSYTLMGKILGVKILNHGVVQVML